MCIQGGTWFWYTVKIKGISYLDISVFKKGKDIMTIGSNLTPGGKKSPQLLRIKPRLIKFSSWFTNK